MEKCKFFFSESISDTTVIEDYDIDTKDLPPKRHTLYAQGYDSQGYKVTDSMYVWVFTFDIDEMYTTKFFDPYLQEALIVYNIIPLPYANPFLSPLPLSLEFKVTNKNGQIIYNRPITRDEQFQQFFYWDGTDNNGKYLDAEFSPYRGNLILTYRQNEEVEKMFTVIVFLLNITAPEYGAKFAFSDAKPGICEIQAQAKAVPGEYTPFIAPWSISNIPGSEVVTEPTPAKGGTVKFKYTNLPVLNTNFGLKEINASLTLDGGESYAAPSAVMIFFPKFGINHPPEAPPNVPISSPADCPNWFYYWSQVEPPLSHFFFYNPLPTSDEGWNSEWGIEGLDNALEGRDYILLYDNDKENIHFCCTGLVHENTHHNDWDAMWPPNGCWDPGKDQDQDMLPDLWEEEHEPFTVKVDPNKIPDKEDWFVWINVWSQKHAVEAEEAVPEDAYDAQDWAYPGRQWSDRDMFAIKGGREDNEQIKRDYSLIDMSIHHIIYLESLNGEVKKKIKSDINRAKMSVVTEKKRLKYLSVDSLITIVKKALSYAGKGDLPDKGMSWVSVEAAAILLGEKGDKRAIPILKEFSKVKFWILRHNNPWNAQIAAAGAAQLLELSPNYQRMDKEEKIRKLLQIVAGDNYKGSIEQYPIYRILVDFAWDKSLTPIWIEALSDSSELVRKVTARVIAINPQINTYDALLSRATMMTESESVREIAIYALGKLKSDKPEIIPLLKAIAADLKEPKSIRKIASFAAMNN